jgi:hypothetical protein
MARLAVEDCWWTDPRRERLAEQTGSLDLADIVALKAWRLAQEFWKRGRALVPRSLFEALKHADALLAVGLAKVASDGKSVYVCGSADYFEWLNEARENGKIGGKISAQRPRDAKGRLLPDNDPSGIQGSSSQNPSESRPSSSSCLKEEKTLVDKSTNPLLEIWNQNRGTLPLARECSRNSKRGRAADARWRERPDHAYWTEVVRRLAASPFCRAETGGSWRATFDFLVQPDTHVKALEGKYDPPARKPRLNTTPLNLETL